MPDGFHNMTEKEILIRRLADKKKTLDGYMNLERTLKEMKIAQKIIDDMDENEDKKSWEWWNRTTKTNL